MDGFTLKTFTTSQPRGYTYSYYVYSPPAATTKPALFLCHGYPDEALLWVDIVPALKPLGHPIIVPDLLGYGGSSKPSDPKEYSSDLLTRDLFEIADAELGATAKIIPVGHDWGSYVAARLRLWRPARCAGLVMLNVAYQPPFRAPFDLAASMALAEQKFGDPLLAYWELFTAADGHAVLRDNLETFFHLMHWDDPDSMRRVFCVRGALRRMLTEGKVEDMPLKAYARKPGFKEAFMARFARDGFEGPQCYYKVVTTNIQYEAEKAVPEEDVPIKVPCLYIPSTGDAVCRTDLMEPVKHLVPDLEVHVVDTNHWCPLEKPEEVGGYMADWLKRRFSN